MKRLLVLVLAAFAAFSCTSATADVALGSLFSDNAVLQRGLPIRVWGTADNGEKVTVQLGSATASVTAAGGRWSVALPAMKAGGPYTLTASGKNSVSASNILIGDVWVCSGQSNMQWTLSRAEGAEAAIAASADDGLRLLQVPRVPAGSPQKTVNAAWAVSSPASTPEFSAVGYFFGRELRKALKVPIGLINTSWGGTPAQSWTSEDFLLAEPSLAYYVKDFDAQLQGYPGVLRAYWQSYRDWEKTREGKAPMMPGNLLRTPYRPASLYNGMIAPLVGYGIKGAIWYQGESNAGKAYEYRTLFPTMIKSWRSKWGQGDFPFLFVQLAPYGKIVAEPGPSNWAELREAQLLTDLNLANTGMAVITDHGNPADIHPAAKLPVGQRLALAARALGYNETIPYTGPRYSHVIFRGDKAHVKFDNVVDRLVSRQVIMPGMTEAEKNNGSDKGLVGWAIAGADGKFYNAEARIAGADEVVVSSPSVPQPTAVRYGWADAPVVNLFDEAGLPASPFRTDDFPMVTAGSQ